MKPCATLASRLPYSVAMLFNSPRSLTTVLVLAVLTTSAIAAHAQPPDRAMSKLDARLAASVRAGDSTTQRVIIRTTSSDTRALTNALDGNGHSVLRRHPIINALTARVPVFVQSISIDAVVVADQTSSGDSTLRGTLGLPVQAPAGNRVGVAVIDSGLEAGPEFGDRISGFYDFTRGGRAASPTSPG